MGLYNILIVEHYACPSCGHSRTVDIQFKFGNKRLHEYTLGDTLIWKSNENDQGRPGHELVVARGIANGCASCPDPAESEYFHILIRNDVIVDAQPASDEKYAGLADGRGFCVLSE
jgi:hypothetical protein